MKKTKTFLLIVLALLVLSCRKKEKNVLIEARGIILVQGITIYQYGDHVLLDNSGNVLFALVSDGNIPDNGTRQPVGIRGYKMKGYPIDSGPELIYVTEVIP